MEAGTPTNQGLAIRDLPEPGDKNPQEQLLGQAHAGMRRHLKGAKLEQTEATRGTVRRIELIDAEFGPWVLPW
jgi:hypothetical protein